MMECDISNRQKNFKSTIAKKLIMFNALSCSRPRTELGQPVLYTKIREGTLLPNDDEKASFRKSMRTISDPDINASLIKADEQFFKNNPTLDNMRTDINAIDDSHQNPEHRKSVKELMMSFEQSQSHGKVKQHPTHSRSRAKMSCPAVLQYVTSSPTSEQPMKRERNLSTLPYEVVTLSCPSGNGTIDDRGDAPPRQVSRSVTLHDAPVYVNCQVIPSPGKETSADKKSVVNGLTFVEDYYSKPENQMSLDGSEKVLVSGITSEISITSTSTVSSGYQSVAEFDSLRGSASMSDTSEFSDDDAWDSDEFDDESSEDEGKRDDGKADKQIELPGPQKKVYNIVMEILTTERAYVKRLDLLEEVYYQRLLKEAKENGTIPEKIVNGIFPNLSSIRTFHKTVLLPDLEKRMQTWVENQKIGDIFKYVGHFLKMYTFYVKNFDEATTTLNLWMKKSPKIASIIDELQKLPESAHLTLQNHMLEPIQRVPRYKLLLQDYVKKLPEDSPDRAEAEESLAIISEAAAHANESMKIMDVFKKLMEIQERIIEGLHGESLITASRRFVKEGDLIKIAARSDKRTMRVLILFNDVILCCSKVPGNKLKVKQVMDVDGMVVRDGTKLDLCDKYSFRIKSRQRVLDLACNSEEAKAAWISAISNAISDLLEKRASIIKRMSEADIVRRTESIKIGVEAPSWIRDDDTIMCMLCASRFWFINRRHHCRGCGRIVCESCSKYKANLEYAGNISKRVCFACYKKLRDVDDTDQVGNKERDIINDKLKRSSIILSVMSGELLWKQPGKGWTRGYFALSEFVLYIYKKKQDLLAGLTIPLPGYCVKEYHNDQGESNPKHAFSITKANIKEMTYYFQADTEETMKRWLQVLNYAVKAEQAPAAETS